MVSSQAKDWGSSLNDAHSVLKTLYGIFAHFKANSTACSTDGEYLLDSMRRIINTNHDPTTIHLAQQVLYQILHLLACFESPASPSALYGMLYSNTDYHLRFRPTELRAGCLSDLENLDTFSPSNCQILVYSLLNMTKVIDLYGYDPSMSVQLWRIIELHLETPIGRVRELLLQIFEHIAGDVEFRGVLVASISENYSWLSRNKYELLAALARNSVAGIEPDIFFLGLTQSLKFRKLMRASQKMVKELRKQPSTNQRLIEIVIGVLQNGLDLEVQNLTMFWATSLDVDGIYSNLGLATMTMEDLTQSPDFEYLRKKNFQNLIVMRHMLAPTALSRHPHITEIDSIVIDSGSEHNNHYIRHLVCEILAKSPKKFISFLKRNVNVEDSALRNFMVIKVKQLLQMLYKKKMRNDARELSSIFRFGAYDRYQETITRLLVFEASLEVTKGVAGLCGFLGFTPEDVAEFLVWLNTLIPSMLTSKFDDIRETTLRLVFRYLIEQKLKILTHDWLRNECVMLAKSVDLNCVACCYQYARILRHSKADIVSFSEELNHTLQEQIQEFLKDPFLAAQQGLNLFGLLNCLNELVPIVTDERLLHSMSLLCRTTAKDMLENLNSKSPLGEKQRPTFERMEQRLSQLLDESQGVIADRWQDEHVLLKSIWLTVKACCELSANLAKRGILAFEQIRLHRDVLLGCCHKGVIEAAGISLGQIVHHFSAAFKQPDLFVLLKTELIDEIVHTKSDDGLELRSTRGLCVMVHQVVKNDLSSNRELFYYCLTKLLPITGTSSKHICFLAGDHLGKFYMSCQPLQLTLLTTLVKDGCLAERMLPFMGLALQLAFEMFKSPSWIMRNSAAQLLAAACSKLAQQKLCFEGIDDEEVTPIAIAYCDIFTKYPDLWLCIERNVALNPMLDMMLLKFMSLFEYRDIGRGGNEKYCGLFVKITARRYRNSQITKQLRKFEANLEICGRLPSKVYEFLDGLFARGLDHDTKMSLLDGIVFSLQRFEANNRHLDRTQLFSPFRDQLVQRPLNDFISAPYWLQVKLLDTLLYLGFSMKDAVISDFVQADRSRFTRPVEIGRDVWLIKTATLS